MRRSHLIVHVHRRSPLMFLVLSVACFSAGLVAFAYSSSQVTSPRRSRLPRLTLVQHPVTSTITTVFSAFSSFGLTAVSAWFASERIVFNRHKGRKWLSEVLDDVSTSGYKWVKKITPEKSKTALTWSAQAVRSASVPLRRMSTMFSRSSVSTGRTDSAESAPPPYASPTIPPIIGVTTPRPNLVSAAKSLVQFQLGHEGGYSGETSGRPSDSFLVAPPTIPPPSLEPGPEVSATRARFRHLARSAVMVNRLIGLGDEAKARVSISLADSMISDRKPVEGAIKPKSSRVAGLVPKLQNMAPTQDIAAHAALVRHMQVSV